MEALIRVRVRVCRVEGVDILDVMKHGLHGHGGCSGGLPWLHLPEMRVPEVLDVTVCSARQMGGNLGPTDSEKRKIQRITN